jgi:hypothetical protein
MSDEDLRWSHCFWQDPAARPYVQGDRLSVLATKARLTLLEGKTRIAF